VAILWPFSAMTNYPKTTAFFAALNATQHTALITAHELRLIRDGGDSKTPQTRVSEMLAMAEKASAGDLEQIRIGLIQQIESFLTEPCNNDFASVFLWISGR
jgi:hypothetical protein